MLDKSSVYKQQLIAQPFEQEWLSRLSRLHDRQIVLIGSGITCLEYAHILNRANITYACIDESEVHRHVELFSKTSFYLIATPSNRVIIKSFLQECGLIFERDFITYLSALRNRAVFDLRDCQLFDCYKALAISQQLMHLKTLGGIDFIVDQSFNLSFLYPIVIYTKKFAHTRLIYYPNDLMPELPMNLDCFDSVDLILQNLLLSQFQGIMPALCLLKEKHSFLHCFVNELTYNTLSGEQLSNIYIDNNHVLYYDNFLSAPSLEAPAAIQNKSCISRRMFPVFDSCLHLKICSLYNEEAFTGLPLEMVYSGDFADLRNALCERCIGMVLHRI